jgi:rhodanese-related sulfurtransferase
MFKPGFGIVIFMVINFLFPVWSRTDNSRDDYHAMLSKIYKNSVPFITAAALHEEIAAGNPLYILDTRELSEYVVSHLPHAVFSGYTHFRLQSHLSIPKDAKIIVYCTVGARSERIGKKLLKSGYKNTFNLYGGIFEWVNLGLPIVDKANSSTNCVHTYNTHWGRWVKKGISKVP